MVYLFPDPDRVILFNQLALEHIAVKRSDRHGVLSRMKIAEAIDSAKIVEGDLHTVAASLLKNFVCAHAFASGNRRTAWLVTEEFITKNDGALLVENDPSNAKVLTGIREGFYSLDDISSWLKTGNIHEFKR